jgi:prepilin-type N-terminal cleavage/methylation domain-containing protein
MCDTTQNGPRGFTLLELLIVVTIIGILAAIAIPQFAAYRQRGYDARANSDLRNAATGEEAYFSTYRGYVDCDDAACMTVLPNFRKSPEVSISMRAQNGSQPSFTGTSTSSLGSKVFSYDSLAGGITN